MADDGGGDIGSDDSLLIPPSSRRKKLKSKLKSLNRSTRQQNATLNSSIVKHTLKSNNRALAKALEACRQELGERDRTILSLQEQQQTLRRVAGLRDNQISQEVDLRIQERMGDIHGILTQISSNLLGTVDMLHQAMEYCSSKRASYSSPRPSSPPARLSTPPVPKRTIFDDVRPAQDKDACVPSDAPTPAPAPAPTPAPSHAPAPSKHACPDLSMIMERSYFMDDTTPPPVSDPVSIAADIPEEEFQVEEPAPKLRRSSQALKRKSRQSMYLPNPSAQLEAKPNRRLTRSKSRVPSEIQTTDIVAPEIVISSPGQVEMEKGNSESKDVSEDSKDSTKEATVTIESEVPESSGGSTRDSLAPENELDISEHDEIFKPRTELPRTPPSNAGSRDTSLNAGQADEDDEQTEIYSIPKFISLYNQDKNTTKKKRLSGGKLPGNSTKLATKVSKVPESKPEVTKDNTSKSQTEKKGNDKKEKKVSTKVVDKPNSEETQTEKKDNGKKEKKVATKVSEEMKSEETQTEKKSNEKKEKKAKRGTFVVPDPPPPKEDTEKMDTKSRRGTIVIAKPKMAQLKDRRKTYQIEEGGILDVSDSCIQLIDDIDDTLHTDDTENTVTEIENTVAAIGNAANAIGNTVTAIQNTSPAITPNVTMCEVQDMEFTEVFPASQLIGSSYPEPGQSSKTSAEEPPDDSQESIFKALTVDENDKIAVPNFVKRSLSLKPQPEFLTDVDEKEAVTSTREDSNTEVSDVEDGKRKTKRKRRTVSESTEKSKRGKRVSRAATKRIEIETESEQEEIVETLKKKNRLSRSIKSKAAEQSDTGASDSEKPSRNEKKKEKLSSKSEDDKEESTAQQIAEDFLISSQEEECLKDEDSDFPQCTPQNDIPVPELPPVERKKKVRERVKKTTAAKDNGEIAESAESNAEDLKTPDDSKDNKDVFKVPAVPVPRKKTKERIRRSSESSDGSVTSQRSRSKRRAKDAVQSYAENDPDDSIVQKTTQESDSDGEKIKKKFNALISQPGKIMFKAGRNNMSDVMSGKSKSHSILPRVKAKSKSRSKPRLPDHLKVPDKDPNAPKSVFDLSLNESVTIAPSQTTYVDFKERQALKSSSNAAIPTSVTELALPKKIAAKEGDQSMAESPHGIMLVLGNGKRTKERRPRSKTVRYARKLTDLRITSPPHQIPTTTDDEDEEKREERDRKRDQAGATPPRNPRSSKSPIHTNNTANTSPKSTTTTNHHDTNTEDPKSPTNQPQDDILSACVPETPPQNIQKTPESPKESPSAMDRKRRHEEDDEGSPSKKIPATKPKSKLSLHKDKSKEPPSQVQVLRQKLQGLNNKPSKLTPPKPVPRRMSDATRKSLSNSPLTKPPPVKKPAEGPKKTVKKKEDKDISEDKNTPKKSDNKKRKDAAETVSDNEDIVDKTKDKKDTTKSVKPLGNSKENREPTKDAPSKDKAVSGDEEEKSESKRRSVLVPLKPHQIKEEVVETKQSEGQRESADGRRTSRRAAGAVSYKEPSVNTKLRQGDSHTTTIYAGGVESVCLKSKKDSKSKKSSGKSSLKSKHSTK